MKIYSIRNTLSGTDLGTYAAESPDGALDAMARDAGYGDYAECCEDVRAEPGELRVTEVTEVRPLSISITTGNDGLNGISEEDFTDEVLRQVLAVYPDADVEIECRGTHHTKVLVEGDDGRMAVEAVVRQIVQVDAFEACCARTDRDRYLLLFDSQSEALDFEQQALSIGGEFLPECARAVLADGTVDPAPEYWAWLSDQYRAA